MSESSEVKVSETIVDVSGVSVSVSSVIEGVTGIAESPKVVLSEAVSTPAPTTVTEVVTTPAPTTVTEVVTTPTPTTVTEAVTTPTPTTVTEAVTTPTPTTVTEAVTTPEIKEPVEKNKNTKESLSEVGVKIMGTVSEVLSDKNLSGMVKLIVDDPAFIAKVEGSVKNILKDGKVDECDIPEFVFLIVEAYNTLPKARLTKEELPEFVSCVFNYLVEKYNLIPKDQRAKYETIVASSVKLVLMTPQFKSFTSWKCPCW